MNINTKQTEILFGNMLLYCLKDFIGFTEIKRLKTVCRCAKCNTYHIEPTKDDVIKLMRVNVPLQTLSPVKYLDQKNKMQYLVIRDEFLRTYRNPQILAIVVIECSRITIDKTIARKIVHSGGIPLLKSFIDIKNNYCDKAISVLSQLVSHTCCFEQLFCHNMFDRLLQIGSKLKTQENNTVKHIIHSWLLQDIRHQNILLKKLIYNWKSNEYDNMIFSLRVSSTIVSKQLGYIISDFGGLYELLNLLNNKKIRIRELAILSITNLMLNDSVERQLIHLRVIDKLIEQFKTNDRILINHAAAALFNICYKYIDLVCKSNIINEIDACNHKSTELSDLYSRIRKRKISNSVKKIFNKILEITIAKFKSTTPEVHTFRIVK